jgi:hypothetical protein
VRNADPFVVQDDTADQVEETASATLESTFNLQSLVDFIEARFTPDLSK